MTDGVSRPARRFRLLPDDGFVGWTPYVWLGYFPGFFVIPLLRHAGPEEWAITVAGGVVFLALYFRGYWARGRELLAIIAVIALMGIAYSPRNVGASVLISYAAAFAGVIRPRRQALLMLGLLSASVAVMGLVGVIQSPFWAFQIFLIVMIGASNMHFTRVREMTVELHRTREVNDNLARVAERERIARDLHDVLGHTLTLITLKSALAARLAEAQPLRAAEEMRDVERVSRDALQEIRAALAGARDVGLAREVDSAELMLNAAGVAVERSVAAVELSATEEATLALAVREAVTNIVRHAGATLCRISLSEREGARLLAIEDDGRGKRGPDGNGLAGMRERVGALGGQLIVDAATPAGTRVRITLAGVAR
jgi:two-component system, NarL family, sensor histidine kinase DesK